MVQPEILNKQLLLNENIDKGTKLAKKFALEILEAGIQAVNPRKSIKEAVKLSGQQLSFQKTVSVNLAKTERIIVVGAGKATAEMATGLEEVLGNLITIGQINIPKEQCSSTKLNFIGCSAAGHPIANKDSIKGTKKILQLLTGAEKNDLVICLLSGGGSAMMELPRKGISLKDLEKIFHLLSAAGATIHELNIVRKHLSMIKGGKLALNAYPARMITLIISDVIGDKIESIASGPTTPDSASWREVQQIIEKYQLEKQLPAAIRTIMKRGLKGELPENPKQNNPKFRNVENIIVANNTKACEEMRKKATELGLLATILSTETSGEARKVGKQLARKILKSEIKGGKGLALIAGGETTVTIAGKGKGGRNQELALGGSEMLDGKKGVVLAAIGTDGKDGPTDAAGAIVDADTVKRGKEQGMSIEAYLTANDSYAYLQATNSLILTGTTGTNVMDLLLAIKLKVV